MAFKDHIAPGSTLVHDNGKAHGMLIDKLKLVDEAYDATEIKKLPDEDNPLSRVNEVQARLKNFLYAHNSFDRDSMQGYLNLFSFVCPGKVGRIRKKGGVRKQAFSKMEEGLPGPVCRYRPQTTHGC